MGACAPRRARARPSSPWVPMILRAVPRRAASAASKCSKRKRRIRAAGATRIDPRGEARGAPERIARGGFGPRRDASSGRVAHPPLRRVRVPGPHRDGSFFAATRPTRLRALLNPRSRSRGARAPGQSVRPLLALVAHRARGRRPRRDAPPRRLLLPQDTQGGTGHVRRGVSRVRPRAPTGCGAQDDPVAEDGRRHASVSSAARSSLCGA